MNCPLCNKEIPREARKRKHPKVPQLCAECKAKEAKKNEGEVKRQELRGK